MDTEQRKKEWAGAALEVTRSGVTLEHATRSYKEERFTPAETNFLNSKKREEANITSDLALAGSTFGVSTIALETVLDLLGSDKKSSSGRHSEQEEEEEAFTPVGTSDANKKEAKKLKTQAPVLFRKAEDKTKQKNPESVFKGLMDNPDAERLRKENLARQRALAFAQQRETRQALEKQASNTKQQKNYLVARRMHQEKLARLGLIPTLEPKSPYQIN